MATPQVIIAPLVTSVQSTAIASTKVRVTANVAAHFAVGVNPTAYPGNCEIIAANQTRYINMQGLNNKIAFAGSNGVAEVTVVQIGTVYASSIPGSTYIPS